ncbi:MAG: tetratricopeptide repeat protein [Pyrinomonadaceae bacterium]
MHKNTILFVIAALLAGFVGGFWLANSINRSAMKSGGSVPASSNSNSKQTKDESDLSDDEIKAKIAEGDKNPTNFAFQKELGVALYHYSVMKKDARLFPEAVRILNRANSLNAKDFDVLVTLGNAHFDIGFAEKSTAEFQKAREIYSKALDIKPGDADVQTDLGISYFVQEPPNYDKAAAELQKVSDANPKHERSLQFLVQALVKQNKIADAEKALAKLKSIDPGNRAIPELTTLISDARSGAE